MQWKNKVVLITGGTGSFGQAFTRHLLKKTNPPTIRIFSRDEFKQYQMQQELAQFAHKLRFFLGDVRDQDRLRRAFEEVDIVIHAAALKQVPLGEYNPFEPIQTNILGSKNVIEAALDADVKKAVLISSDKAVYPINLYGATKMCAEKLFVQGNAYGGGKKCKFLVVRYGNVLGSRGSVVPLFMQQKQTGKLELTHKDMTRFWITLSQACKLVETSLQVVRGGEIFVPKLPSVKLLDLAHAIAPKAKLRFNGIRPGEKLHESLMTEEESRRVKATRSIYIISPEFSFWKSIHTYRTLGKSFVYRSDINKEWITQSQLQQTLLEIP